MSPRATPGPAAGAARLLRELAAAEGVEVPVAGTCMAPELASGQRVRLERADRYWPGDLIAFRSEDGRLLLHRMIGWRPTPRGWRLLTQADTATRPDAAIEPDAVIGRLIERDGRAVGVALQDRLRALGRFVRFAWAKISKRNSQM